MSETKELVSIDEAKTHLDKYRDENYKPTKESLQKFDEVIKLYEVDERPLYKLFPIVGISPVTFYMIKNLFGNEMNKVARAREARQEARVEQIKEISEDLSLSVDERKLRIYAIKEQLQLESPKRYRDKQEITVNNQVNNIQPIQVVRQNEFGLDITDIVTQCSNEDIMQTIVNEDINNQ